MQIVVKSSAEELQDLQVLEQLERILSSTHFATSPRCRAFLRYVVDETLTGHSDGIKERTIAMEVFGKDSSFEPGEDSVVRVKAREVRKRLVEFYDRHPDELVRIHLPLGGYVPTFERTRVETFAEPVPASLEVPPPATRRLDRRAFLWGAASLAALGTWPLIHYWRASDTPLDHLWQPVFATQSALLISIPLLRDESGAVTERVGLGAATAANETAEFLGRHHYPYRVRFGSDLTFAQIREQPSLLLGGFSSTWTTRITDKLRFTMVPIGFVDGGAIRDNQTGTTYGPIDNRNTHPTEDFALVCRLFDVASGQIIMIAAGITTFGTESAARFLLRPELFSRIAASAPPDWRRKNFQAVVKISIIDKTPSTPTLVTTHFW